MTDVIVEILGGVVQNVAVNKNNVRVIVIDWDNIGCLDDKKKSLNWVSLSDTHSMRLETSELYKQACLG